MVEHLTIRDIFAILFLAAGNNSQPKTEDEMKLVPKSNYEINKSIRKGWNGVKAVERVDRNRKRYHRATEKRKGWTD